MEDLLKKHNELKSMELYQAIKKKNILRADNFLNLGAKVTQASLVKAYLNYSNCQLERVYKQKFSNEHSEEMEKIHFDLFKKVLSKTDAKIIETYLLTSTKDFRHEATNLLKTFFECGIKPSINVLLTAIKYNHTEKIELILDMGIRTNQECLLAAIPLLFHNGIYIKILNAGAPISIKFLNNSLMTFNNNFFPLIHYMHNELLALIKMKILKSFHPSDFYNYFYSHKEWLEKLGHEIIDSLEDRMIGQEEIIKNSRVLAQCFRSYSFFPLPKEIYFKIAVHSANKCFSKEETELLVENHFDIPQIKK